MDLEKRTKNEINLFSLLNLELKRRIIKVLKGLREAINRNADHCKKNLETRNRIQLKNLVDETKAKLKAINNKQNNENE